MRIFLDSANIEEIRTVNGLGCLSGVTTNPSLVAKEKRNYFDIIRNICSFVDGPVSAEVVSTDYENMLLEAQKLSELHQNVVVKVPISFDGLQVINKLQQLSIKTNATLIFSANQALLAAQAGATFVSPFIGRIDDIGYDGLSVLADIIEIFKNAKFNTQIISASIRHPMHVVVSAKLGAHIATIPYAIIKQMINHPLTDAGIERFSHDWLASKLDFS